MAVLAIHLHRAIRAWKIGTQMRVVIQLYLSRILATWPQHCELWMCFVEVLDFANVLRASGPSPQIGMALRATGVGCARQPQRSLVLEVTGTTGRPESHFVDLMRGRIVTFQTGVVTDFRTEKSQRGYVTDFATLREDRMRRGKRTTAVNFLPVGPKCGKPHHRHDRDQNRQPQAPTAKGMWLREILQIHPLGQLLGCPDASQHVLLSIAAPLRRAPPLGSTTRRKQVCGPAANRAKRGDSEPADQFRVSPRRCFRDHQRSNADSAEAAFAVAETWLARGCGQPGYVRAIHPAREMAESHRERTP